MSRIPTVTTLTAALPGRLLAIRTSIGLVAISSNCNRKTHPAGTGTVSEKTQTPVTEKGENRRRGGSILLRRADGEEGHKESERLVYIWHYSLLMSLSFICPRRPPLN